MTDQRPSSAHGGERARPDLPVGTVTFLRTDVEGSMDLARAMGDRWDAVNAAHLGIIRRAVDAHGGVCVRTEGDAFFGAFAEAGAAIRAAAEAQRGLAARDWPGNAPVRVRMGLHTGEAHLAGDDYGGFEVNRAARVAAAGHGGQVVLSEPTRILAGTALTDGLGIRDLGRHVLRGVPTPERLFQLDIPGLRSVFPPLRAGRPSPGNLPARLNSFIGRDGELADLDHLLSANRILTLTGPGGIGKTSLAVELGRLWLDRVPDGVWFVGLDGVTDPALVPAQIARSLGLFDGPERPAAQGFERYLADKSAILVIDNFEHLLAAAGDVAGLLRAAPSTRVVVTSRAALRITGEQEYPVGAFRERRSGRELFVQRARAVRPGWDAGPDESQVDAICELLDGLPLGIELAAARIAVLPLATIRDRLASRLPLPGSGPRDVPSRQRTLEAAIGWSHDLLSSDDQRLLHELAVFEGSFDVDQAAAVAGGDILAGLATLVEQSLLVTEPVGEAGGNRYRLLQTIRAYALERLAAEGRDEHVRRRHADAYLVLLSAAAPQLPGPQQTRWLPRLAADHANIRAATRWAIDSGELELALGLVAAAWRFWQLAGYLADASDLAAEALAMPGADRPTAARLAAVTAAAGIAYWRADVEVATRLYEEELALAIHLGDRVAEADAHFNLTYAYNTDIDADRARAEADEAMRLYHELGDARGIARLTWTRGTLTMARGDIEAALPIFREALEGFERAGDAWYHAMGAGSMAWACFALGRFHEAVPWAVQSLLESNALRDTTTTTISLAPAARIALEGGMPEQAATLLGAFENLSAIYGVTPPSRILYLITGTHVEQRTREALEPEALEQAMDRGRRMSLAEAVALVVEVRERLAAAPPPQ